MPGQSFLRILQPNRIITFLYTNHRGEETKRRLLVKELQCGYNDYYPTTQFLLNGYDLDKKAYRSFALSNIVASSVEIEA